MNPRCTKDVGIEVSEGAVDGGEHGKRAGPVERRDEVGGLEGGDERAEVGRGLGRRSDRGGGIVVVVVAVAGREDEEESREKNEREGALKLGGQHGSKEKPVGKGRSLLLPPTATG